MSEDAPDEDEADTVPEQPLRGTASRPNPFAGEDAPETPDDDATVTINAPDGSVREYELTENVKSHYERRFEGPLDRECEWYEMWWDGTKLVIQYVGTLRDDTLRPNHEELTQQEIQQMLMRGQSPSVDGIPKKRNPGKSGQPQRPRHPMGGGRPQMNLSVDVSQALEDTDMTHLDEGLMPVINRTTIDIQKRADELPLQVEDMFIQPWDSDAGQEPINSEHADGEVSEEMFEVDFRNVTDDPETTVPDGARGDRWDM